jgi:ring-1,2-phenylacetyl-CoA epoxidase subunit PaaC
VVQLRGRTGRRGPRRGRAGLLRDAHEFKNCLLLEQPNGNYADTLVRQFFFDAWHYFLIEGLTRSSDARIAAIAENR